MLRRVTRNSHVWSLKSTKNKLQQWVLFAPDIHWDHPKCDRDLLKRHLDLAREKGARVILPGDTFCLMQGKYDPRGSKSDIRPEHNNSNYILSVIETAAEWFAPWQDIIDVVGLGNHETSVSKRVELPIVQMFVTALNTRATGEHRVEASGYTGWYIIQFQSGSSRASYRIKYNHGWGGGGPVTMGAIDFNRMAAITEGADCIVMGHIHRAQQSTYMRETLNDQFVPVMKELLMIRCSSYKDEYKDGHDGWHVEKGMGPRPLGGEFLCVNYDKGWAAQPERGVKAKPSATTAYSHRAT